jgi:shikimate kinase
MRGIVLATGGGAILREQNRNALKKNGFIVYLQCSVDRILERTRRDTQRPLLHTANPRERLENLFAQREALYLACADYKIDTGAMQSKAAVNCILQQYRSVNH